MKERVLDVLMYLFDHCIDNEDLASNEQHVLVSELEAAGFSGRDIDRAFDWLEGIHEVEIPAEEQTMAGKDSFRVFSPSECKRLSAECRGLLLSLEALGILNKVTREVILDRVMALNMEEVKLDHFKWITLMVLINRGNETSIEWLEEVVFNDNAAVLH